MKPLFKENKKVFYLPCGLSSRKIGAHLLMIIYSFIFRGKKR
jgi:hypothetical protein